MKKIIILAIAILGLAISISSYAQTSNYRQYRDSCYYEFVKNQASIKHYKKMYYDHVTDSLLYAAKDSIAERIHRKHINTSSFETLGYKEKTVLNKILFTHISLDTDSAGGNDVIIHYVNKNDKPIKYAYFSCDFYNAVNDKVYCEIYGINGKYSTLKSTGPINPEETRTGCWGTVIYNYSAKYAIIKNIKIVYMDGSEFKISLTKKEFENILNYYKENNDYKILEDYIDNRIPSTVKDLENWIKEISHLSYKNIDYKLESDKVKNDYKLICEYYQNIFQAYNNLVKTTEKIYNEAIDKSNFNIQYAQQYVKTTISKNTKLNSETNILY